MSCFESVTNAKPTSEIKYATSKENWNESKSSISHIVFIYNNVAENRFHEGKDISKIYL